MYANRFLWLLLATMAAACFLTPAIHAAEGEAAAPVDTQPVAKIGETEVVTKADWDRAVAAVEQGRIAMNRQRGVDPAEGAQGLNQDQKMRLLNSLIDNRIALSLAKEAGIAVTDEEVKKSVEERKAELPSGTDFNEYLQQRGLTEADAFQKTKERLLMKKFEEIKTKDIAVSEEELKQGYDKLKERGVLDSFDVQHILVKALHTDQASLDKAKTVITAAYDRVKKGEDFTAVAKEVSEDPGSKDKGGEYKGVRRGQMVPEFDKIMSEAKVGEVSEPFRTQFGWHILKVNRHDSGEQDAALTDKIREQMLMNKKKMEMSKLIQEARSKISISINLPADAAAPGTPPSPNAPAATDALLDQAT